MSACKYCGYRGRLAAGSFCSLTCEALQRVYQRGRDEERAAVVAWLRKMSELALLLAKRIPLGETISGGGLHGASSYNVATISVETREECAEEIEKGEHEVKR